MNNPLSPNAMIPILEVNDFIRAIKGACAEAHDCARSKGFWTDPPNFGEKIALIHSELSEAMEAHRHGNPPDDKVPEFSGIEAELADVIVRVFDLAEGRHLRLAEAIVAKMRYNRGREYKHGKIC